MILLHYCSIVSMSGHVDMKVHLQVQVQFVGYNMQCVGCSVLPPKDEDLAVEKG